MKNLLITILMIFLSVGSNSYAFENVLLQKDEKAPFTGILFPTEDANKIRVQLLERDTYLLLNNSYEKSLKLTNENAMLKDEQIKLLGESNLTLTKRLKDEREIGTWERLTWFALGVLATSVAVYGTKKITQ